MQRVYWGFGVFVLWVLLPFSMTAVGQSESEWLADQLRPDGGLYSNTDLANPYQSTLEALSTRLFTGQPQAVDPASLSQYVTQVEGSDTELLAAKVIAGTLEDQGQPIADTLLSRQNSDGGFGSLPAYQSTPYDTYWAVRALDIAGSLDATTRFAALQYLLDTQNGAGSWGYITTESVFLTGRISELLTSYQGAMASVGEALTEAHLFLSSKTLPVGVLTEDFFGPCTALSSLSAASTTADLADLADSILDGQQVGGSWENDVFSTAICMRALLQYEASQQGQTLSSVSGTVVVSGSTQPLAGVAVESTAGSGVSSLTDAAGRFALSGLGGSVLNLELSKPGFLTTVQSVTLTGGQVNLGNVPLAVDDGALRVQGTILDAGTGAGIASAAVSLEGSESYQVKVDSAGEFYLSEIAPGDYTLRVSASGYYESTSAVSLNLGNNYNYVIRLNDLSTVLDDTPGPLSGRIIDGITALPLAGATVSLEGATVVTTGDSGLFTFSSVDRGDYTLSVAAAGYATTTYQLTFPPGSSGAMGDLALYAVSLEETPEDITLSVRVRDAVSGAPVGGASISQGSTVAQTGADGTAVLSGITSTSFTLQVSAEGYHSQARQLTASGYGNLSVDLALTPSSEEPVDAISLSGTVTDAQGAPIPDVVLDIDDAGLGIVTDAEGRYTIADIEPLSFTLSATKAGFRPYSQSISVDVAGNYFLDLTLEAVENEGWQVYYVNPPAGVLSAHADATFAASIQQLGMESADVLVRGRVYYSDGTWIADVAPFTPGATESNPLVTFGTGEVKVLTFPFNTGQLAPGTYLVKVDLVEPGSISRDLPNGVVFNSNSGEFSIQSSLALEGDVAFEPPLTQAGSETPVSLTVLVANIGNDTLAGGTYTLTIANEAGDTLLTRTAEISELPSGDVSPLAFGEWVPTEAGHLSVQVVHNDLSSAGEVLGTYYVGDVASGVFILDQHVFPEGDQVTGASLAVHGVDTTQGSSTDPLFERAIEAVRIGGEYVGDQAVIWHRTNRCLGCHIQTQSLVGMASSMPYTDIDEEETRFLFNVIASSQQNSGRLRISHDNYIRTQQQLATWALTEWPDIETAHRVKLRGLRYLWSLRSTSGGSTYWTRDHQTGWLSRCCEGGTAIATRAIVDLIQSDEALAGTELPDYQLGSNIGLNGARGRPRGMHQDGAELTIAKQGMIERYNLQTGASESLYLDSNNRQFMDVAVDADGTIFATTDTSIVKIWPSGEKDEVYLSSSGIRDIVFWQGDLFVTDYNDHRIWRVTTDLEGSVFTAGNGLNQPYGLTVSSDGEQLIVTNYNGYNLSAISPDGTVSLFSDGFAFRPAQIMAASNSESYYVSTQYHSYSGATSPTAVHLVKADGTILPLVGRNTSTISLHALAEYGDGLVFTDYGVNVLGTVTFSTLDRSFVETLRSSLPSIANYFLANHQSNTSEITRVAFRLMGLAEIEKVTTDPTLLAQIASAKDYIAQLLRNRQNSDGGWGMYSGHGSDPLTTAWVGYALDYTDPSAEDPMVRNAITYLLNAQRGDGSWSGRYFSTRLGSTSLVMAYMPRALQRLGGLDVGVELTIPPSIELLGVSKTPDSTEPLGDGAVHYSWELQGVTGAGQRIEMDLGILDLALGEQRPVADLAELHFANSFTGEEIIQPIDIPAVTAASEIGLSTGTDKPSYVANEPVAVTTVIANGGPDFSNGRLEVQIRSARGDVVETISVSLIASLPAGAELPVDSDWNTALYSAGAYQVFARVKDSEGEVEAEAVAAFTIVPSDGEQEVPLENRYGASIATDRKIYTPYATVQLTSKVINEVLNASQAPVLAALRVSTPGSELVFSRNIVIDEMAAGAVNSYWDEVTLSDAAPGLYFASITVWDAPVQQELARNEALFTVIEHPQAHLTGTVSVDRAQVYRGQTVVCSEEVANRSQSVTVDTDLVYRLVNVGEESDQSVDTEAHSFNPGARYSTSHDYSTSTLAPGGYACVLQAQFGEEVTTLDFASFTVELPPVEFEVGIGNRGRLLILMDQPGGAGENGTSDIAALGAQEAYLRALLDQAGFSYTIVFSAEDFTREFYSGTYHSYALMSEKIGLDPDVEYQLGEAVNAGAGLYIAGAFNRRNNHLEKVLGIESSGREQQADGVVIPEGALGPEWPETIFNPHTKLDFERCGSNVVGAYVNPVKGTATTDFECYNLSDTDAAVVAYRYGEGRAVYMGFDTLDEATLQGGDNAYAAVMVYGLGYIQPAAFPVRAGAVIPVSVALSSFEVPVVVHVQIDLPDNLAPIDQVPGMTELDVDAGLWQWSVSLPADAMASALFYVRSLDGTDAAIDISIQVEIEDEMIQVGESELRLNAEASRDFLGDGRVMLEALVMNYPDEPAFSAALADVDTARAARDDSDAQGVVDALLNAVRALSESTVFEAQEARRLLDREMLNWLEGLNP